MVVDYKASVLSGHLGSFLLNYQGFLGNCLEFPKRSVSVSEASF